MAGWEERAFPLLAKIYLLVLLFLVQKDCLTGETAQPVTCMLDKHDKPGLTLRTHTKCRVWWHVPIIVSGQGHPWVSVPAGLACLASSRSGRNCLIAQGG